MDVITSTIIDRIQELCSSQNISVNKMLLECGLGKSIVANLKKGSVPTVDKLSVIAKYFDVPMAFLIGDPPFDCWDDIKRNRETTLHYMWMNNNDTLKELLGTDDINSLSLVEYIKFIDITIVGVRLTEDGDFDIKLKPWVRIKNESTLLRKDIKDKGQKNPQSDITFNDFTYAMYNESQELTEENKQKLLEMARFFKEQQDKEKSNK